MNDHQDQLKSIERSLERIAYALENSSFSRPAITPDSFDFEKNTVFLWNGEHKTLNPIENNFAIDRPMLVGLDDHADTLYQNTLQFAEGYSANNALLWGARGMGKSTLVKAVHAELSAQQFPLILIEILREDLSDLGALLGLLRAVPEYRFLLFCDDLSFDQEDSAYKSLKAVLEGGVQSRPDHVLIYATSNRRHLMPRDMIDNERRTAIHGGEATEEKVSLSDRFGLWLGFYPCNQDQYFEMVDRYAKHFDLTIPQADLHAQALEWSMTRGARSGRVAWQFVQNLAGQMRIKINQ